MKEPLWAWVLKKAWKVDMRFIQKKDLGLKHSQKGVSSYTERI